MPRRASLSVAVHAVTRAAIPLVQRSGFVRRRRPACRIVLGRFRPRQNRWTRQFLQFSGCVGVPGIDGRADLQVVPPRLAVAPAMGLGEQLIRLDALPRQRACDPGRNHHLGGDRRIAGKAIEPPHGLGIVPGLQCRPPQFGGHRGRWPGLASQRRQNLTRLVEPSAVAQQPGDPSRRQFAGRRPGMRFEVLPQGGLGRQPRLERLGQRQACQFMVRLPGQGRLEMSLGLPPLAETLPVQPPGVFQMDIAGRVGRPSFEQPACQG
jgi:hypothetical protein